MIDAAQLADSFALNAQLIHMQTAGQTELLRQLAGTNDKIV